MKKLYNGVIDLSEATRSTNTFKFDYDVYTMLKNATSVVLLNVPSTSGGTALFGSVVCGIGSSTSSALYLAGIGGGSSAASVLRFTVNKSAKSITITYPT